MKRIKAGLTLFDIMQREDQQELFHKELKKCKLKWMPKAAKTNAIVVQKATSTQKAKGKPEIPPLLITLKIAGKNLHNCLVDGGAGGNIMPYETCKKLNLSIVESPKKVTQLDKIEVRVVGMVMDEHIQIAADPRIVQYIDIQIVDIPKYYGLILAKDWSSTLNGYIATDYSHIWLPWRGVANQIRIEQEPRLKETIIDYNNINEILVTSEDMGVYLMNVTEVTEKENPILEDSIAPKSKKKTPLALHASSSSKEAKLWTLKFDGSKSNQGSDAGVELQSPKNKKYHASYRLQFHTTCNTAKYEALIHGLKLALIKKIKHLQVVGDSKLVVKQVRGIYTCKDPRLH